VASQEWLSSTELFSYSVGYNLSDTTSKYTDWFCWNILSRDWMTVNGVWIDYWIYWTLTQLVTTLYKSLVRTLLFSVIHVFTRSCFATVFTRCSHAKASTMRITTPPPGGRLSHNNLRLGLGLTDCRSVKLMMVPASTVIPGFRSRRDLRPRFLLS
jgi:hypothetical protein